MRLDLSKHSKLLGPIIYPGTAKAASVSVYLPNLYGVLPFYGMDIGVSEMPQKILVIDDDDSTIRTVERMCRRSLDAKIIVASSTLDALHILDHNTIDLVLLDINLRQGDIDGIDLLRKFRHIEYKGVIAILSGDYSITRIKHRRNKIPF